MESSKVQLAKPFEHAEELSIVLSELTEINNSLDIGKDENTGIIYNNEKSLDQVIEVIEETEYDMEGDMEL